MEHRRYSQPAVLSAILLVIAAIYTLFAYWAPPMGDDLLFVADYIRVNPGGESLSAEGFAANAAYMRATDNVRLQNLFMPFFLLGLPKWGLACLSGLLAAGCIALTARASGRLSAATLMAAWVLTGLLCPWRGATITTSTGYIVFIPAIFNLLFLIQLGARRTTPWRKCALALTALLACTMHEGWAVPMACGLAALALTRRMRLPAEVWVSLALYAAGSVWLMTAPGMMQRAQNVVAASFDAKLFVSIAMPAVMAFCALVYAAFRRNLRHFLIGNGTFLTLAVAWCASIAINLYSRSLNPNSLWISDIISIVIILSIARKVAGGFRKGKKRGKVVRAATALALAVLAVFYANVLRVQHSIYEQNRRIDAALAASPSGTAFVDVDIRVPHSTLLHPVNGIWWNWQHIYSANELERSRGGGRLIAVVPTALAQLDTAAMRAVPGCAGVFDYRGILLAHDRPLSYSHWTGPLETSALPVQLTLTDADGEVHEDFDCLAERFTAPDGSRMLWIRPLHADVDGPFAQADGAF